MRLCTLKTLALATMLVWMTVSLNGQISSGTLAGASLNTIKTAVSFLTIAPDGRSTGMGDLGVASSPDPNSQHWNAAKYVFLDKGKGGALNYTPWLTNLIPNIYLGYLTVFYKINEKNALSSSLRYFSLGEIVFPSLTGIPTAIYYPEELAVDIGYSRKFTDHFSGGLVLRYIHSDLTGGLNTPAGDKTSAVNSFAGDFSLYYQRGVPLGDQDAEWALGLNISNVGPPVSYTEDAEKTPIPTNLRFGGRFQFNIHEKHTISIHSDLSKLLVPTSPVLRPDSVTGDYRIVRGKEAPSSMVLGIIQSFYDAPGVLQPDGSYSVMKEELHEIAYGFGAEYAYKKRFAVRSGYFHEHSTKGNRKYFTLGAGASYSFMNFDISYLIPLQGQNSYLWNTFRFSVSALFGVGNPEESSQYF